MAWTGYAQDLNPSLNYYVKPADPLDGVSWAGDAVNGTHNVAGEFQFTGLDDAKKTYNCYNRLGGTPAETDTYVGQILQEFQADLTNLESEVRKIPRGVSEVNGGATVHQELTTFIDKDNIVWQYKDPV